MSRNELHCSDQVLIDYLYEGFKVKALTLHFIEVGSFYGFVVETNKDKKYFLKVYPKHQSKVPIHPTMDSLNQTGIALNRFKNEFGLNNISYMLPNFEGNYCFETNELVLTLFDYIEGTHPTYSPNQLLVDRMAAILLQLHQIPIQSFSSFEVEQFDISYAFGLKDWINNKVNLIDPQYSNEMLSLLEQHKKQLLKKLVQLQEWKEHFSQQEISFVITHGDPHHYNVLQTPLDVWLVDWDGIKIAPIERDLWHYEHAFLLEFYQKLNPQYRINHELCRFYQFQRFFEDCRYYLEQVLLAKNKTMHQSEEDKNAFLSHWGWSICLK
ncbi:TPA: aminoglycoside phosphotransferase family protein [Legionella pneumophila]|nr:aminoglycoside phosphotransferase family protein [Legionella pneumophila]HAU0298302.1 aminoglycoside phosphotransferase family protein [Legionella pneumophila]